MTQEQTFLTEYFQISKEMRKLTLLSDTFGMFIINSSEICSLS